MMVPTVLRRWLAFELARLRKAAGVSQKLAADRLDRAQSYISNLERGPGAKDRRNIPALAEVEVLLDYYGRHDLIPQFRQLLEQSKRAHWWEGLPKGVIPPLFDFYLGLEEGAVSIECYDALTVTGLLQCRAYAEVLLRAAQQYSGASQGRIAVATGLLQGRVSEIIHRVRTVTTLELFERTWIVGMHLF